MMSGCCSLSVRCKMYSSNVAFDRKSKSACKQEDLLNVFIQGIDQEIQPPTSLLHQYEWILAAFARQRHVSLPANIQAIIVQYLLLKYYGTWSYSTKESGYGFQQSTSRSLTLQENGRGNMKISVDGDTMFSDDGYSQSTETEGNVVYQRKRIILQRDYEGIHDQWKVKFSRDGNTCTLYRTKPDFERGTIPTKEKIVLQKW
eukprot:709923_1